MALDNEFQMSEYVDFDAYSEPAFDLYKADSYLQQTSKSGEAAPKPWARIAGFVLSREKAVVAAADSTLELTFRKLARKAFKELGPSSDLSRLFTSAAYLEVIGLGPGVIPLLLRDMRDARRPWFVALAAISRHDAAHRVAAGDIRGMMDAWLAWGRRKRILE